MHGEYYSVNIPFVHMRTVARGKFQGRQKNTQGWLRIFLD